MKMLVNIRGTNGAGKSTVPKMMYDKYFEVVAIHGDDKHPRITLFPDYMWLALGTYNNKTGGMDTLKNNEQMLEALEYAWTMYPQYDILMEGIIASTVFTTYAELFKKYERRVANGRIYPRKILIINYLPPVAICIDRVYERNGGKKINENQVKSKWVSVERNHQKFLDEGLTSIRVNTAKVKRKDMVKKFVELVEKYRRM